MSEPDLSWLGKTPKHYCDGSCSAHSAGIAKDEGPPRCTSPEEGGTPKGSPGAAPTRPVLLPEDICEDCACPLKDHSGTRGNCVYCACKVFVPIGPKE